MNFRTKKSFKSTIFTKSKKVNTDVDIKSSDAKKDDSKNKFVSHPISRVLYGSEISRPNLQKYVTTIYQGLFYSVNNLKGPSEGFIKKKSIQLP